MSLSLSFLDTKTTLIGQKISFGNLNRMLTISQLILNQFLQLKSHSISSHSFNMELDRMESEWISEDKLLQLSRQQLLERLEIHLYLAKKALET